MLASFRSLTDNIDTTSLGRAPRLPPVRAFAQFERDLIKERTGAGLLAAAARGSGGGGQSVVTPDKLEKAKRHIAAGIAIREAAARTKGGTTALYKHLHQNAKIDGPDCDGRRELAS